MGEYPGNITVVLLTTDDKIVHKISSIIDNQLMISGIVAVPNNLNTFIINISMSNDGGEFNNIPSFIFGKIYFNVFLIVLYQVFQDQLLASTHIMITVLLFLSFGTVLQCTLEMMKYLYCITT